MALEDLQSYITDNKLAILPMEVPVEPSVGDEVIDFGRTLVGQGALLGFGDELEAKVRSLSQSRPYEVILAEIRKDLKSFEERNPGTAITSEILGAIAPTALMMMTGVGAPSAVANTAKIGSKIPTMWQRYKRAAPLAAGESATYEVGKGEKGFPEDITNAPEGAFWGLVGTAVAEPILAGGQQGFNFVYNKIREKWGDKMANVVMRQIDKLRKDSGLTISEVIEDIATGRILADNQTIQAGLSAIFADSGKVKRELTQLAKGRESETRRLYETSMQQGITPKYDGNIVDLFNKSDDELYKEMDASYKKVWANSDEITPDMVDELLNSLRTAPEARKTITDAYLTHPDKIAPFMDANLFTRTGEVKIVRMPTLEDLEIVRRELYNSARKSKIAGDTTVARNLRLSEDKLRQKIDDFSPNLKSTRAGWRHKEKLKEAYEAGQAVLRQKAEKVPSYIKQYTGTSPTKQNAEYLKAFRMGALIDIKDNMFKPGYAQRIADPLSKDHTMIRHIFPDDKIDDVLKKADNAADAIAQRQQVTGKKGAGGGSPTHQRGQAEAQREAEGIVTGSQGAAQVAAKWAFNKIFDKFVPNLDDVGRSQVLEVLYSKNPDFVRRALTGETDSALTQQFINDALVDISQRVLPGAVATQNEGVLEQFNIIRER